MSLTSNNCPDCGSPLGKAALKCRCGWKASSGIAAPVARIDCCHVGCGANALVRIKTETGWGNFCQEHYIRFWQQTLAQPREVAYQFVNAHCEAVREKFGRSRYTRLVSEFGAESAKAEIMREPGQDDEVMV